MIPKPAERFEAAETLLAYGWGRPPQYVDLALASSEVKRIEVRFEAMPLDGNESAPFMAVDVTMPGSVSMWIAGVQHGRFMHA